MDELMGLYLKVMLNVVTPTEKDLFAAKLAINTLKEKYLIHPNVIREILLKVEKEPFNQRQKNLEQRRNKFLSLNLINYKYDYFHPYLFIINKPVLYFDEEDRLVSEDYVMKKETKDRFSYNHILGYIKSSFPDIYLEEKKDIKILSHLLTNAIPSRLYSLNNKLTQGDLCNMSLDILMFTIDACCITYNESDKKLVNLISLSDFVDTAIEMRDSKINCIKENQFQEQKQWRE